MRKDLQEDSPEIALVRILKRDPSGYTSGGALSEGLGISRTAVWKHIKSLRKAGYRIQSAQSKGYRLVTGDLPFNGIEVASGLSTEVVGRRIYFYPELDSTNTKAFELGRMGEPEGTAVIADSQRKGKGRVGRTWESPPGVNLYTSIILRPGIPPQAAHNLTFLMAVATAETVEAFSGRRPTVKWPNDILVDSRKVAGILLEMDSEADSVHFIVAGIGVNINTPRSMFLGELKGTATSIVEKAGQEVSRAEFTRSLYSNIEKWYKIYKNKGFAPVAGAWKGFFPSEGKTIRVNVFDRVIKGICLGIDPSGALLVRTPQGGVERILSGDMESRV